MMPLSSRTISLACFSAATAAVAAVWLVLRHRRDEDEQRSQSGTGSTNTRRQPLLRSSPLAALLNRERAPTEGGGQTAPSSGRHHSNNKDDPPPPEPMPIILVTDPGQDLDDEMALIMARHLIGRNLIDLRGVIANLTPSFARARLARGTLDLLGLHHVPVGIGTDGGDRDNKHTAEPFEESARSYTAPVDSEAARALESGPRLLQRLYDEAGPKSLSLVVISSMKDAALFVRDNPILFAEKTRELVVMGGCKPIPAPDMDDEGGGADDADGSCSTDDGDDLAKIVLEPDTANNNTFDMAASSYLYRRVQELGVTFVVASRYAAYAAKMPRCVYDDLALTGSSIGWRLRNSQRASIDGLWRRACASDPGVRGGLPDRCDRSWFINTFCGGEDDPRRGGEDTVWDLVTSFMQYDTVALLAAVPSLRETYFSPLVLPPLASVSTSSSAGNDAVGGARMLIGRTDTDHNVRDPTALGALLRTGYATGLACNHHAQPSIVLCLQLRWDNLADTLLTCLMLRSLWDLRLASCLGVVISLDPSHNNAEEMASSEGIECGGADCSNTGANSGDDGDSCGNSGTTAGTRLSCRCRCLRDLAEDVCNTFHSIGLSHVNLHVVEGTTPEEHTKFATNALLSIYESAPPIGVTLVLTSTFTSVWPFADRHPELFRNKTVRVVHTGGALAQPSSLGGLGEGGDTDDEATASSSEKSGEMLLVPDPAAQNHRLDLSAARRFYRHSQALSVPLVVLSRHVAKECCIPRNFFDVLETHGGPVGRRIFHDERQSLLHLWRCASAPVGDERRCNLPPRCDRDWFAETFCAGQVAETEEDVWPSVKAINLYSPIALLAALPGATLKNYFETMPFTVRSATHLVIGLTAEIPPQNVKDHKSLRSLVVQSLLSAALANESEFWQDRPTPIPLSLDDEPMAFAAAKSARRGSLGDSDGDGNSVDEDTWYFTETARRRLFNKTVAMSCKNLVMPGEKKRKVVRRRFSHPDSSRCLCPMQEVEGK